MHAQKICETRRSKFGAMRNSKASYRAPRRGLQQFPQLLLVERGVAGGEMPARLRTRGNQIEPAILHVLERSFSHAGLRRIAFVVGGIDRQQRGGDPFEPSGIVIVRGFPLIDEVVGVSGHRRRQPVVDHLVGLCRRWRQRLIAERAAACRDAVGGTAYFIIRGWSVYWPPL